MAWKIDEIKIENLKFYCKPFSLKLKGQNALIFGENGAGKSSIYWSVYTHFQAAFKDDPEGRKYFIANHPENLRNRFSEPTAYSGIKISFFDGSGGSTAYEDSSEYFYPLKKENRQFMEKTCRTSDFLNYKLISSIFDFKNSEDNDIFGILNKEVFQILDFPVALKDLDGNATQFSSIGDWWNWLSKCDSMLAKQARKPNTFNRSDPKYKVFEKRLEDFNSQLQVALSLVFSRANVIIQENFKIPVKLEMEYTLAKFNEPIKGKLKRRTGKLIPPKIIIKAIFDAPGVKDVNEVRHPKSFFNEAKLACMGIAFRLAILEQRRPVDTACGVLILDDVMHSLDMSVRKIVVPLLLDYQKEWQMIVMTHDRALFNLFRIEQEKRNQRIKWENEDRRENGLSELELEKWRYLELFAVEQEGSAPEPYIVKDSRPLQAAAIHLKQCRIPECANTLRSYCEQRLKNLLPAYLTFKLGDNPDKSLYGLIEAFNKFFIEECRIKQLHDLYLHIQGDREIIFNPFSHNDLYTPFYRNELAFLIKNLSSLEEIQVLEIMPAPDDIRSTVYIMSLESVDGNFNGWVKFKFNEFLCEVRFGAKKFYNNPKISVIEASDPKIIKRATQNKGATLHGIFQNLRMFLSLPKELYGPEIIEKCT